MKKGPPPPLLNISFVFDFRLLKGHRAGEDEEEIDGFRSSCAASEFAKCIFFKKKGREKEYSILRLKSEICEIFRVKCGEFFSGVQVRFRVDL